MQSHMKWRDHEVAVETATAAAETARVAAARARAAVAMVVAARVHPG